MLSSDDGHPPALTWNDFAHGSKGDTFRYVPVRDKVLFSAHAPLAVCAGSTFSLRIWAYLRQQEEEAKMRASEKGDVTRGSTRHDFLVARGELVTITLLPSEPFTAVEENAQDKMDGMLSGWTGSADAGSRCFVWSGDITNVRFRLFVKPDATLQSHECVARIVCGCRVLDMAFTVNVTSVSGTLKAAGMAAAAKAREKSSCGCFIIATYCFLFLVFGLMRTILVADLPANSVVREMAARGFVNHAEGEVDACDWMETRCSLLSVDCPTLKWDDIQFEDVIVSEGLSSDRGAHGMVRKAIHKVTGRRIVIKEPALKDAASDGSVIRLFKHEAAVQAMVSKHPNVVELLGLVTRHADGGELPMIALECVDKGSLDGLLAPKHGQHYEPLSPALKRSIACGCAAGLATIHASGVLHNDVAARNVLISAGNVAKVSDFGLSSRVLSRDAVELGAYGPVRVSNLLFPLPRSLSPTCGCCLS